MECSKVLAWYMKLSLCMMSRLGTLFTFKLNAGSLSFWFFSPLPMIAEESGERGLQDKIDGPLSASNCFPTAQADISFAGDGTRP
jgi:hypothetical protein